MILVGTAGILVATSQARSPCATEITKLRAETTCGPAANVVVTSDVNCAINAKGADLGGLPTLGSVNGNFKDAGIAEGFNLSGITADAGNFTFCTATPVDGGFSVRCVPSCGETDAGCEAACSGTLAFQ